MNGCEVKHCRHYRNGKCAYGGISCIFQEADNGEPNAILLPLKEIADIPFHRFSMPDWQDWGWNKAMREAAKRMEDEGIPCKLI